MFKTMMPVAAAISLAAGLLGAAPAQAAVKLPAGCTSDDSPRYNADVYALECSTLSNNANFTQFPNLEWLTIGPETSETKSRVTITSLPKLPATLTSLSINAPKVKSFAGVTQAKNLSSLTLYNGTNGLSMAALATSLPRLNYVFIHNAKPIDYSPLSKLRQLRGFFASGSLPAHNSLEYNWTRTNYPIGLNGRRILPTNSDTSDENGKKDGKQYSYDAKTNKIRWNGCWKGRDFLLSDPSKPATKNQPYLDYSVFSFNGPVHVKCRSDWSKDRKTKLQVVGSAQVGKTITAKLSNPQKFYIDKYQWNRNGKPIKGATKASYKLTNADFGKKITVSATDNRPSFGFTGPDWPATEPYTVTKTATSKVLYGFTTKKPTISGSARVGSKFTAKNSKWGGSPTKYTYQWMRNGKPIKGATKSSYKLTKADRNKKIAVKVSGSKKNYQTASATSSSKSVR